MNAKDLLANSRISPLNLQIRDKTLNSPSLLNCRCRRRHRRKQLGILSFRFNSFFNVIEGRRARSFTVNSLSESDVPDLPVEICMTRTLDPALTLADGMEKIKEAIGKLKADPPQCWSGVLRFQVAVPPSVKALDWLYCQPRSLAVFPQFYLSPKHIDDQSVELNPEDEVCQVSGIGSSVHINIAQQECTLISRYLSVDSPLIRAYGFVGINFDPESSEIRLEEGSIHLFIPQIEVDEFANISILAATLVWDDFLCSNFEEAIHSLESSLNQAIDIISPIDEPQDDKWLSYFHGNFDVSQDQNIKMIYLNYHSLIQDWSGADILQMGGVSNYWPSYFRLSITISFTSNKLAVYHRPCCSLEKCANINVLWASLIVEECVRLGVTYFCIAPGSRSSPLAIAASMHSLTTCISCFDERSLAYHAVGFARGSNRPAAVITSSGTAVSNLLPAVVEASNDFVPLLLLTADRPPELQDTGANQAINQVNHFGSFVRFFFGLPPPTDEIPARMVLTTIDSAVYSATQVPKGPVHINCSFREPLENIPCEWTLDCLRGLDLWISKAEPFTQYVNIHHLHAFGGFHGKFVEIIDIIQNSCRGLLLIGAIHTEDEIWAALVLAKHLKWPVITDILSGLRLRKVLTSVSDIEKHIFFVDHFDHALLSDAVRSQAQPDVVVQIGSRITSKRIAQMLEACSLCSYILVDNHPHRHDPSHIITHRVQSTICDFADALIKIDFPRKTRNWNSFLQVVNKMVEWEIEFQIHAENSLTEPHVAHVIMEALRNDAALFIGNSMVIRDADMYGRGNTIDTINMSRVMSNWKVPCQFLRIAGNRGASGIDGLLSTAVGFATGCKKRVLCVVGDMSFLHDTNGLAILNQRILRKPITILVINNHGGAIFSLLPVAGMTQPRILNQYFYTSHNISINNLCKAHSLKHLHVQTKEDLQNALLSTQQSQTDCIIEVESCIKSNATFHSILTKSSRQAADCAMNVLARFTYPNNVFNGIASCKINRMEYSLYRIQLSAPCTSTFLKEDRKNLHREGFVLSLFLDDGSVGFGEVAPIEIHKEDLLDVEEQLRFLLHMVHGAEISYLLSLLRGSFSSWIWRTLGIPSSSLFPSVRCGMEMAILHALAARQGCYLVDVISGYGSSLMETSQLVKREGIINKSSPKVQICALLDSEGTPKQIAHIIAQLSNEGFKTIKLKVARRSNPDEDAAVIQEIRKEVGYGINLRADANRIWTYEEAIQFGSHLKCCDLQYVEEPVCREDDIIRFCEETGLPAALDETIDNIEGDPLDKLQHFVHPRIVALVIKPSMVGGFENAMKIAKWAHRHDKMAVISSAFESSLSLSAYVQFASYIESQNKVICRMKNKELQMTVAHGLGTYRWLREDLSTRPLKICVDPNGDTVEASVEDAGLLLQDFQINQEAIQRSYKEEQFRIYQTMITHDGFSCSFTVRDSGPHELNNIIIFLHGYLGTSEDWIPIMKALSVTARCISIDLPGHGGSRIQQHVDKGAEKELSISIELIADMLHKLITEISSERVVLVGYSMGARIALYMALRYTEKINGAVIISGGPGLKDELGRRNRIKQDDAKARNLLSHGLQSFLEAWYAADLWFSLRNHPHFQQIVDTRARHKDITDLARILSDSSVGRQPSLWEDLKHCETPLLLVSGEKDAKFKQIAHQMHRELISTSSGGDGQVDNLTAVVEVPDCGHVVHLENPLPLINAVRKFFNRICERRSSNANNLQVS